MISLNMNWKFFINSSFNPIFWRSRTFWRWWNTKERNRSKSKTHSKIRPKTKLKPSKRRSKRRKWRILKCCFWYSRWKKIIIYPPPDYIRWRPINYEIFKKFEFELNNFFKIFNFGWNSIDVEKLRELNKVIN